MPLIVPLMSVIGLLLGSVSHASVSQNVKKTSSPAQAIAQPTVNTPVPLGCKQAYVIDLSTHTVLFAMEENVPVPPSSMSKLMAILIAFEHLKKGVLAADTLMTVSERAWKTEGSRMFLNPYTQVKVMDLLRGIIIQSGNDATVTLAEGMAGSESAFVDLMNQKAQEWGLKQTTFMNSHGLPDENHRMPLTALAILAEKIITLYPEYYGMFSEKDFTYNKIKQGNRNPLLYSMTTCDGLKTGHTEAGGYGLVASAIQNGRRLILVINGCPSMKQRSKDAEALMNWAFTYYTSPKLLKAGQSLGEAHVWLGDKATVSVAPKEDVVVTLPRAHLAKVKVEIVYAEPLATPLKQGDTIGEIRVTLPNQDKPTVYPLVAQASVGKANVLQRIKAAFNYLIFGHSGQS
jgi:D-alanyl-D-alanine carboxypeptidase (penicillin-binding protein 5/6)